jgi:hypothetical protein
MEQYNKPVGKRDVKILCDDAELDEQMKRKGGLNQAAIVNLNKLLLPAKRK